MFQFWFILQYLAAQLSGLIDIWCWRCVQHRAYFQLPPTAATIEIAVSRQFYSLSQRSGLSSCRNRRGLDIYIQNLVFVC